MRVEAHSILVKNGTRLQQSKTNMPAIKQIDAGNAHTIMLLETGEIFTWGDNYYGQLGLGYASRDNTPQMFYLTRNDPEPQMVDAPTRIRKFDYVVEEFDGANSSQTVYTTVTGCVIERVTARKTLARRMETDITRAQMRSGREQLHVRAGEKLISIIELFLLERFETTDRARTARRNR